MTNQIDKELARTKRSMRAIRKDYREFFAVAGKVVDKPVNLLYGLVTSCASVLLGMWFANIGIIQSVFSSSNLSLLDKFDFLFTMVGSLFSKMDGLQIVLIITYSCLWLVVAAFWLEVLQIQNERPKLRQAFAPTLIVTLCIGAVGIISISLVTPVITFQGVSVFVSQHFSGTILLLATIVAEIVVLHKFVALIRRTHI
jgi:hypothetical protein